MSVIKKRTQGRAQKYIADICLIGGSTKVASKIYTSALESARLNNDTLWMAGCTEGLCGTQFLLEASCDSFANRGISVAHLPPPVSLLDAGDGRKGRISPILGGLS